MKKEKVLVNPRNFTPLPIHKTVVEGKSNTVPNMSYSIEEILEKSIRGMNLALAENGTYEDEPDHDNVNTFADLTDLDDANLYLEDLNNRIKQLEVERSNKMKENMKRNEEKKAEKE